MGDEYDDGHERRQAKGSNTTLWVVLAVLAGVVLVVTLACGGILFFGYQAAKDVVNNFAEATGSAESFLSQLQAGNTTAAYQATSQTYRKNQTQAQFDAFVAANPNLSGHTGRSTNSFNATSVNGVSKVVIQFTLTGATGSTVCTITLVDENGTWVVDSITIP